MSGERTVEKRNDRLWYHVDDGQIQLVRQMRHAICPRGFDEDHVETGFLSGALQHRLQPAVTVHDIALRSRESSSDPYVRERTAEHVQYFPQGTPVEYRHFVGRVDFRIVFPVAIQKRREHGNPMTAVGERPEHRAHKVPVTFARNRFYRQNPRTFRRTYPRPER